MLVGMRVNPTKGEWKTVEQCGDTLIQEYN